MKNMNRYLSLVALIISLISCQSEDNPNRYELIPYPNDMEQMSGRFSFDDDTQIFISPECGDESWLSLQSNSVKQPART